MKLDLNDKEWAALVALLKRTIENDPTRCRPLRSIPASLEAKFDRRGSV